MIHTASAHTLSVLDLDYLGDVPGLSSMSPFFLLWGVQNWTQCTPNVVFKV